LYYILCIYGESKRYFLHEKLRAMMHGRLCRQRCGRGEEKEGAFKEGRIEIANLQTS
jgi:hypothetical protein